MQIGAYKFDRMEFAGSLGDLGTLIPLSVALMIITGLSVSTVLLMVGAYYILGGIYFKLPIPVQPLKVVSAIAIAFPEKITLPVMAAAGVIFGLILLVLAFSRLIDLIARLFTKPIIRGIQLGLGFILVSKGISYIGYSEIFIRSSVKTPDVAGVPVNLILGIVGAIFALLLITSKRFPAALVITAGGIIIGILLGSLKGTNFVLGPTPIKLVIPSTGDFLTAFFLLVIPQIPLTLGNAVMGTADACFSLFEKGDATRRSTYRAFAFSMGFMNIVTGMFAGMPMCHGSGGLAAHFRFGARTGGSNIMIGTIFLLIALLFGKIGIALLSSIPNAILGVLLLFAGLELALLVRDLKEKKDYFVAFLIAGIGLATINMAIAFVTGIIVLYLIERRNIEI
jgi:SulP family sulfate permease